LFKVTLLFTVSTGMNSIVMAIANSSSSFYEPMPFLRMSQTICNNHYRI